MKLQRAPSRPQSETIVALIDVIFFLLVFFMLVGRMDATTPFEVIPPEAVTGADVPIGGTTVAIGADGQLALNGTPLDEPALLAELNILLGQNPQELIRVNANATTELRFVQPVVAQIEAIGAENVSFVVTPNPP